jgi:hypothetical protein
MKATSTWLTGTAALVAVLSIVSCSKNGSSGSNPNIPPGKSQVSLYMMDAPIQFDSVFIDVRQVAVEIDTASKQDDSDNPDEWSDGWCGRGRGPSDKSVIWDTLDIAPGVYNLLALRNGTDTLLGSSLVTTGKILKIRITLGNDNKVYTDSTTSYPLEIFGPKPWFTINVSRTDVATVSNNQVRIWLDFNLARSIFFWNGQFLLSPYLVVFNDQRMAKVEGTVQPRNSTALVTAIDGADTLYAVPFRNGQYQFRNVPTGSWSFAFKGMNGYQDTTLANISVDSMKVVKLPTITLHK